MNDAVTPVAEGRALPRQAPRRRIPSEELDRRLAELGFGKARHEHDQEIARILADSAASGWTQQELAERLKKSQRWVSYQMQFGRFLNSSTMVLDNRDGDSSDLSTVVLRINERVFRTAWDRTDKDTDEESRFAEVQQILAEAAESATEIKPSKNLADKLMARFADGKWHAVDAVAARLEVPHKVVEATVKTLPKQPYQAKVENKTVGVRPHFRIFHADRMIRLSELKEKFGPIVEELIDQGKRNAATVSIGAVAHCAAILKRQIDEWAK